MSDGSNASGGIGQAANQLLDEMVRAQTELHRLESQRAAASAPFHEVLKKNQLRVERERANRISRSAEVRPSQAPVRGGDVVQKSREDASLSPEEAVAPTAKTGGTHVVGFIQEVIRGQDKMTHMMNLSLSGYHIDPYSLIDLQAAVYRYSQELDLTTKVMEKAVSDARMTFTIQT